MTLGFFTLIHSCLSWMFERWFWLLYIVPGCLHSLVHWNVLPKLRYAWVSHLIHCSKAFILFLFNTYYAYLWFLFYVGFYPVLCTVNKIHKTQNTHTKIRHTQSTISYTHESFTNTSLFHHEWLTQSFSFVSPEKVEEYSFSSRIIVKHVGVNFNHNMSCHPKYCKRPTISPDYETGSGHAS